MMSSRYTSGPLSESEVCLSAFANRMREAIPEAAAERPVPISRTTRSPLRAAE
jgi:hypothetical protein